MIYNIDIAGTCNLRCPSCPVGNHDQQGYGLKRKSGFMDIQMFEDILTKIGLEDSEPEIHHDISVCSHHLKIPAK